MLKKFAALFGRFWPTVKTVGLTAGGAAVTAGAAGTFGPKGVAAASAVTILAGLFSHRPQDNAVATGQEGK